LVIRAIESLIVAIQALEKRKRIRRVIESDKEAGELKKARDRLNTILSAFKVLPE